VSKEVHALIGRGSVEFGLWWLQLGNKLKPEGREHFKKLSHLIATGQQVFLSDHIRVLNGYDYTNNITGLENLVPLKGENIVLLGNHSHLGPLEGYGEMVLTNYYIKKATDKEIRWIRGQGKSLKEYARRLADKSLGTIPARDDIHGARLIFEAFDNKDTVGLYPEGANSISLRRADPRAGNLILKAAQKHIPIVPVATHFKNYTFFLVADTPLNNEQIQKIAKLERGNKVRFRQILSDYAMARIATHLPPEKRGYYQNPEKFIDAFEALTSTA